MSQKVETVIYTKKPNNLLYYIWFVTLLMVLLSSIDQDINIKGLFLVYGIFISFTTVVLIKLDKEKNDSNN